MPEYTSGACADGFFLVTFSLCLILVPHTIVLIYIAK